MTHQLFFWGKDLGIKFATIGREINPKGPGTKTQGLMTLTRQPVVQPFWMGAYKQDSSANKWSCPEAHLRRKNFAEKLEHPLGGSARPREPPLSNAARYYHYNRAPMRWSAVLSCQMLNFQVEEYTQYTASYYPHCRPLFVNALFCARIWNDTSWRETALCSGFDSFEWSGFEFVM